MKTLRPKDRDLAFFSRITRRGLLLGAGAVGIESRIGVAQTLATKIDHTIRIAPASLEIASGKIIKTTAYNGTVPGPALRLQEGKPVAINVINDSGYPNLVHWHGLYNPSTVLSLIAPCLHLGGQAGVPNSQAVSAQDQQHSQSDSA